MAQPENISQNTDTRRRRSARSRMLLAVGLLSALTLAGCDEHLRNHQSFIYKEAKDDNQTLITDAQQRVILNQKRLGKDDRRVGSERIICAEPSPDVAQAFTQIQSLSVELGRVFSGSGAGIGSDNSSALSLDTFSAISTSLTKLGERLAVIQLFRDRMYRACEAYNNGALDEAGYTLMMARYDKTMATLLTTEMAAEGFDRSARSATDDDREKRIKDLAKLVQEVDELLEPKDEDKEGNPENGGKDAAAQAAQNEKLQEKVAELSQAVNDLAARLVASQVDEVGLAGEIGGIHRNFLDDSGIEPLIDACLVSLSNAQGTGEIGKEILDNLKDLSVKAAELQSELTSWQKLAELPNLLTYRDKLENDNGSPTDIPSDITSLLGIKSFANTNAAISLVEGQITIMSKDLIQDITGARPLADSSSELEKQIVKQLRERGYISSDSNGDVSEAYKTALTNLTEKSKKAKIRVDSAKEQFSTERSNVLFAEGRIFDLFCFKQVLGTKVENSIISRMLNSRKDLRKLAICEKLIDSRNSYDNNTVQMIVGACVKPMTTNN